MQALTLFQSKTIQNAYSCTTAVARVKLCMYTLRSWTFNAIGGTLYGKAFEKAFQLLKTSPQGVSARKKVIIFLTDGKPTDGAGSIMQIIKNKNAELNNTAIIMTFGMLVNVQILQDIANQDGSAYGVPKTPDITVSYFYIRVAILSRNVCISKSCTPDIWSVIEANTLLGFVSLSHFLT